MKKNIVTSLLILLLSMHCHPKDIITPLNITILPGKRITNIVQRYGLSVILPGKYKTCAGKGYWEPKPGEPLEISLKNPAIGLFVYESSCTFYYWDKKTKTFKDIQISD